MENMTKEERKKWLENLGLEGVKVETVDTPVKSGVTVIENEETHEDRRAAELEKYRENAGL